MASDKIVVLISGGNAGIGYEITKKIATEHSTTHHVLMGTRDMAKGESAVASMGSPSNVTPIQLDITSDESINTCYETTESRFSRLDILINNAGSAGRDIRLATGGRATLRETYNHVYSTNCTSAAILTETMTPLLERSQLAKVIFISSRLGSITKVLQPNSEFIKAPYYNSSKSAMNMLAAYYSKLHEDWKVNSVCPVYNATALNGIELTEETDPRNGAIRAVELVMEGREGVSGTYSEKEGSIPW